MGSLKTKLALTTTIILWASAFPAIRAGLEGYSPGSLALLRFLIASFCLLCVYCCSSRERRVSFKDALLLFLIGAVTIGGYHIALNNGELTVQSGVASFIVSLSTLVTIIFAVLFLNEKLNKNLIIGIVLSALGVAMMTLTSEQTSGSKHPFNFDIGILFVLYSAFAGGIYSVLQKPFLKKYHAIDVTAYIIWGATLFLLIFTPDLAQDIHQATLPATLAVVYLGIFPAAMAYVLWTYALMEISASRASLSMYFLPIFATLIGWVWLKEVPSTYSMVGGVIILLGVWITTQPISFRRRRTSEI